jgi:hypothetical protein
MWKHCACSTGNLMDMLSFFFFFFFFLFFFLASLAWKARVIVNVVPTCGNQQQQKKYKHVIWI